MEQTHAEERRARRWFELEPPAPERLELQTSPRVSTVASYVFTRAAERSWEILNQHLGAPQGGVFWIGGPAGCGKTHFLDYVIALQRRAGALDAQNARRLVCGLELAGRITGLEVEMFLLSVLAEQIGGDARSGDLFRQLRGAAALNVALETAWRTGIRAVTVAIDFGTSDSEAADFFAVLAQVAASFRQVKFTVIAASRVAAPQPTRPLSVEPRDANEETTIAVRRARRLVEDAELDAGHAYAGIDTAGLAPDAIFPFHPAALKALRTIASRPVADGASSGRAAIVPLSRLAREVLASSGGHEPLARLIYPPDLTMNAEIAKLLKVILPEAGRAAWKIARDTIAGLDPYEKDLAREIVDSLIVENVSGTAAALPLEELKSRLPMVACGTAADAQATPAVRDLIRRLEVSTGGVIRLETDAARFDPAAAGAPELAAFNAALALARGFDPALTIARDRKGLDARLNRLDASMALAVEGAVRTREVLASALRQANLEMPPANNTVIAEYIALAESGAVAMLEAAADRSYLASAIQISSAYEVLAAAAESIPRMRAMREYLAATGLRATADDVGARENVWQQSAIVSLETECELLRVELGPRILTGPPRSLDALEARFQKFKWTLRAMLLERACAMAREDGAARAGGGRCAAVLRYARAAQRDRRAGPARRRASRSTSVGSERPRRALRTGRRNRARDDAAMLELPVSARRVVAAGGTRRCDGRNSPRTRDQAGCVIAEHDRAADSRSRQGASPRRISENHASGADRRARASTRRQARALPRAGARRGREVNRDS
jgi:hypothetical protein